jgi:demethylmenaquinone methyltransferase/2-methoxy-6-polyprenyl-1,4-benzoquinol methylase
MNTRTHKTDQSQNPESTQFGTETVTPDEKTDKVLGVFDSVATKYDIMNDVMSGGLHRVWKDKFIQQIAPKAGDSILDMAGGTGDIAFRHHKHSNGKAQITVSDINQSMLDVGESRAYDRGITGMDWIATDAAQLPFKDDQFDIYTIAFGLRNVTKMPCAKQQEF